MSLTLPQFEILQTGLISKQFYVIGIYHFHEAVQYVARLPYGRNSDRADYSLLLPEQKGTCSTKHACLAQLCLEQGQLEIRLCLGIYKMNENNTPGVGQVLAHHAIAYIPEAHCYLQYQGRRYDFTKEHIVALAASDILKEEFIRPQAIGVYKTQWHKDFLKNWIPEQHIPCSIEQLWKIREECIQALS